jgi:hypothetical protein
MEDKICVKISVYKGCWVDEVVYYRYKLPLWIVEKWKWYFEYLAARIKVKNPKRKVELIIVACDGTCGQDYISEHAKNFLKAKKIKLKKLRTGRYEDDLFGFAKAERNEKEQSVMEEIAALERGEFNYWVPTTYINKIKNWI